MLRGLRCTTCADTTADVYTSGRDGRVTGQFFDNGLDRVIARRIVVVVAATGGHARGEHAGRRDRGDLGPDTAS